MFIQGQPQQVSSLQVAVNAMVTAMVLNVFATSLGMIIVASGAYEVAPKALKVTDPAIEDLKKAFGAKVVNKALKDVPDADAIKLAQRVEFHVQSDMRRKYGDWAANHATEAAPAGDLQTAIEIAKVFQAAGIRKESKVSDKAAAVSKGRMRGRAKAEPQKDTKTGIVYKSKYAAGTAVAAEYGLDPRNTFAWYGIKKKDPDRFMPV